MKRKMKKKLIAFMLCMVLVICNSVSILADTPAAATTTAENQVGETKTAKNETTFEENKSSDDNSADKDKDTSSQSDDPEKEESDKEEAPETKTTEKKEETTEATTEAKEDTTTATTEAEEGTSEAAESSDKEETTGAEDDSDKKEGTSEISEETTEATEEASTEKAEETTQSPAYDGKYEDSTVTISVSAEAGIVPEGAELSVTPIVKTDITDDMSDEDKVKAEEVNAQYDLTEKKLAEDSEANEETMEGFLAYDISFIVDGEEVEPNGDVKVVMDFKEAAVPEGVSEDAIVAVKHLKEDETAEDGVVVEDMAKKADIQTTDKAEVEKVELTSDSFSTYTITWQTWYSLTIHIVDKNGDPIGNGSYTIDEQLAEDLCSTTGLNLEEYGTKSPWCPEGYYLIVARLDDVDGTDAGKVYYYDNQWKYSDETTNPNDYRIWTGRSDRRHVYLIYGAETTDTLTTVNTVENLNEQYGISISMKDLDFTKTHADYDAALGGQYSGPVQQGLVQSRLSNDYPQTQSGTSLEKLFNGGTDVNNFFIRDTLEDEGYFEYSSFNNYAYLNEKRFEIYNQKGAVSKYENAGETEFYFHRGNFLPYDSLTGKKSLYLTNLYDEDGNKIARTDSRFGQQLYLSNRVNYHFSMQMTATFLQPRNGITDRGDQMVFEFNGDDDMWVFINKVLILDIGGEHDAHSGTINFATGVVTVNISASQTVTTSLNKLYEEANVFPDGTTWNDEKISDYFVSTGARDSAGDLIYRFKDYDRYTMKMFYLERGAGASNLHVRFNLQTVPDGTVTVAKELDNTDKEKYANEDFQFELYVEEKAEYWSEEHPIYTGEYEQVTKNNLDSLGIDATLRQNGVDTGQELKWADNGTIFLLKPDQSVVFSGLKAIQKYYVKEVGVESNRYDEIRINTATVTETDGDGNIISKDEVDGTAEITSSKNTVYQRPIITFTNNCSAANHRELHITKVMSSGQSSSDKFAFRIQFEGLEGTLVDYDGAYYLIRNGEYYYYNSEGDLVSNENESKICGYADNGIISNILVGDKISITGLLSGTKFNVTEVDPNNGQVSEIYDSPQYEVKMAENALTENGASGTIMLGQGMDAEVTVTNSFKTETITVTKNWTDNGTLREEINTPNHEEINTPNHKNDVIYVGLYQYETNSGPESAQPVSATSYKILSYENNWKGTIEVTKDEKYSYTVKELELVDGQEGDFTIDDHTYSAVVEGGSTQVNGHEYQVNVSQAEDDVNKFTITNARLNTITINKQDNNKEPLSGATFRLEKLDNNGNPIRGSEKSITTTDSGQIQFTDLEDGNYRITETQSPDGYSLLANPIEVTLPLVLEDGKTSDKTENATGVEKEDGTYYYDLTYTIINNKLFTMPEAGGRNIFMMTLAGTAMIALAAGSTIYYRRRRGVHNKTRR